MTTLTLGLVLISALAHALWNFLAKRSPDRLAFLWLMNVSATLLLGPAVVYLLARAAVTPTGLAYGLVSGLLQVLYFWSLGRGYTVGDLSLVYPVARGTGPALVTLFAMPLFGEVPSPAGLGGIALIVLGVYGAHLPSLRPAAWSSPLQAIAKSPGTRFALLTGLVISCYTLWDRAGVSYVAPLLYGYFGFAVPAIAVAPYMLARRREPIREELRQGKWHAAAAGLLSYLAYGLVLVSFTMAKVSYVAAAREVGIVFGALLGAAFLREKHGRPKIAGAAAIFAGVALIAGAR